MTKLNTKQLEELASQRWFFEADIFDNKLVTYRRDPGERINIGPLTEVNIGCTMEDDDGDECFDMTGRDGLYATMTACLPDIAGLILAGVDCDDPTIQARCRWLAEAICERDETLSEGMGGALSGIKKFDEMVNMLGLPRMMRQLEVGPVAKEQDDED